MYSEHTFSTIIILAIPVVVRVYYVLEKSNSVDYHL
jgi:hypothetical protein